MLNYQNDSNVRLIKNNTGADVGQYEVLKLDGPVFTPTDNATGWLQRQTFKGATPTADCDFAITQRAVPNGKTQPSLMSGVTPCTIEVSDASHTHAVAGTTAAKLVSATSGPAKILWKETGTGTKNAVVQLSQGGAITEIPAATVRLLGSDSGIYKKGITTTKTQVQLQLLDNPSLWLDYWEPTPSGITLGQMNIKLSGAYVCNIPFEIYLISTKTNQIELNVVGTNIFVYTDETPLDVKIELWAAEAGNNTYGDGVLLDRWHNQEADVGLSKTSGTTVYRSGVLTSMFESEADDFELQVWHYDANNTVAVNAEFQTRPGGWLFKLPNSIDTTFDAADLAPAVP